MSFKYQVTLKGAQARFTKTFYASNKRNAEVMSHTMSKMTGMSVIDLRPLESKPV